MAGDPPELAQDNPPPWSGGSTSLPRLRGRMADMRFIPPGLILLVLFTLVAAAVFYAALPYRRRAFVPILVLAAVGFALGQGWDLIGLPSLRAGQANVLPGLIFALALQPLTRFVPRTNREPKEPSPSNSSTPT